MAATGGRRRFSLVLIKPSHYDDDGYVIQWLRSPIPSTTLANLYGLARDCADRRVLGDDVDIDITVLDETNTRIRPERVARAMAGADGGLVGLVGVQSNEFPRAMDIARRLRAEGVQVCIGGFHVSADVAALLILFSPTSTTLRPVAWRAVKGAVFWRSSRPLTGLHATS